MKITVLTLFPDFFSAFQSESIIGRAIEMGKVEIVIRDIRDYCYDKHKQADDMPFGGGAGMVMKPEPLFRALADCSGKVIYTSPQGEKFSQKMALDLSEERELVIIAGHYEGIDERVIEEKVDMEISIGDYVLTGGELPAMVMMDSIIRLLPGVIRRESYENDSFFQGLLDYPQYTRPADYEGCKVPEVLLSGHHKKIEEWRFYQSVKRTLERRPDLLQGRVWTKQEKKILGELIKK
ncbi:tRNA (guanine-N(1)-)-methyltransferase [Fusobacterium gonidiaformans 3-1-5R]|uniref:tRNA (guanine-N(1)-)-methyltransferase n=1 Tax=Fusobacterium gonidiaformans 3-1-5R TaxID=469605 RepID=E5BGA0_9FUSO|nr:tRNA (guanosine(37)-N1)-methyltransferase TrmD [Fusobacterium gonidiaformans]AVQ16632.1 tRNA (guanosine(37)-N1)-methyltransferase TrmD [Fusobacterium gonidiaformans ATCC 25563]EFS21523.1 tRNA (guanine-N(1)-)-methyltransferase [Fusobacterium gonidiaformans 3-1-5R]EFS28205.1 tRNA (guanine-N1)-methyltransferase [Fusobacterium gonidiaformans ATCC 25563]